MSLQRPHLARVRAGAALALFLAYGPGFLPAPVEEVPALSRRLVLCSGLAGLSLLPSACHAEALWRSLPDAEVEVQFPARFIAYLTRFLLNFDADFQALWKAAKAEEMDLGQFQSTEFQRDARFARFARTVQLSLAQKSSSKLLDVLLAEYGKSTEAKRQICILFSLLQEPKQQPVAQLRDLLRSVENASVAKVVIVDRGEFRLQANISRVTLQLAPPPGTGARAASVFCRLQNFANDTARLEAIELRDAGCGYARDMDLSAVIVPDGLEMLRPPKLTVQLTRPAKLPPARRRAQEALPDQLPSKMTNLLPPFLLPEYNAKLDRLVPDQSLPLTPDPSPPEEQRRLDEVFGKERQLDRFRADFVFAEFDPTYGPVGISPLEKERQLGGEDYLRLMAAGGIAGVARTLTFLPVQNVKVQMQTNPSLGSNFLNNLKRSVTTQPTSQLYRAADVACIFSAIFGFLSFGVKEYLTRELMIQFPGFNELLAIVLASIASVIITLAFAAPWEVLTTRVMASRDRYWGLPLLLEELQKSASKTFAELYEEYWLLTGKEVAFVVTKFVIFDSIREALLFFVPAFVQVQSLVVACLCGALAGALGAIVSHPIDTLFALRTTGGGKEIPSLDKLFRGVGARVLIYSPGIALTFLVYDAAKTYLGVGPQAIMQTLDLLRPPT